MGYYCLYKVSAIGVLCTYESVFDNTSRHVFSIHLAAKFLKPRVLMSLAGSIGVQQ